MGALEESGIERENERKEGGAERWKEEGEGEGVCLGILARAGDASRIEPSRFEFVLFGCMVLSLRAFCIDGVFLDLCMLSYAAWGVGWCVVLVLWNELRVT